MKWKRTAMSLALAGCMMATTVPVTAFAANTMAVEQAAVDASDDLKALLINTDTVYLTNVAGKGETTANVVISVSDSKLTAGTVTAESGDENIATVTPSVDMADGKAEFTITADTSAKKKTGTTTITFTATKADGTEITTTCKVTVSDPVYITGVSIPNVTLEKGKTYAAADKAVVTPANTTEKLTFSSWGTSDPSVATVANGTVTAAGRGTATITGYYSYGKDNTVANVKFTVAVTDKDANLDVTNADGGTSTADAKIGDTIKLTAKFASKEETVTWKSSNTSVATVGTDGTVKVVGNGSTVITATAADGIQGVYTVTAPTPGKDATDIAFDKTALTLMQGSSDNTLLTVVTTPDDAEVTNITVDTANMTVNGKTNDTNITLDAVGDLTGNIYKVGVADTASVGTYEVKVPVTYKNASDANKTISDTLEFVVTVTAADASKAQSIDLKYNNTDSAELDLDTTAVIAEGSGQTTDIVVSVIPATAEMYDLVSYSTDDPSVAKVVGNAEDGYKVLAVGKGSCYLTASIGKYSDRMLITVDKGASNVIDAIKMDKTAAAMLVNDDVKLSVKAQVDGNKTWGTLIGYTVLWSSSNEKVATVDNTGKVVAKGVGTATITATVGGKTATCTVNVYGNDATVGFVDVPANAWYANAVNTAAAKGLMNGTGNNKFEPLKTVQRSQVAAIVWNIEGAPAVTGTTPFTDVAADAWYAQAVTWAYQNKVVSGTSATTFAPNQNITRQDFAVVLYNKAGKPAASADLSKFVDASKINSWAQDAVKWAVSKGIINGNDKNELNPTGTLTRAEAASIIVKYVG